MSSEGSAIKTGASDTLEVQQTLQGSDSPSNTRHQHSPTNQSMTNIKFNRTYHKATKETMPAVKHETDLSPDPAERPFDLVIFAASSSVGRFLVEELALVVEKHYSPSSSSGTTATNQTSNQFKQQHLRRRSVPSSSRANNDIRWAVAGRSAVRLSETLCRAELSTGIKDLSRTVPVILADLNHDRSLISMCKKAKVVVNCAGPYSDLGAELLIQACIECRTNYIDLAHETTFVELIHAKYSERARRRGVFILNGCGFQSMSAEMGLNFTKQVADGRVELVKIILSLSDTKSFLGFPFNSSCNNSQQQRHTGGIVSEGMWNSLLTEKAQEVSVEERLRIRSREEDKERKPGIAITRIDEEDELEAEETPMLRQRGNTRSPQKGKQEMADHLKLTQPSRVLERKDTRSLVMDIVQFRNRNTSMVSWPLQFLQNFQGQRGRGYCWPIDTLTGDEAQLIRGEMNNYELRRPDLESADGTWRPIRCSTLLSVRNFTRLCGLLVWLFIFQILVKFSLTRYLMRKMPHMASLGHVVTSRGSGLLSSVFSGRNKMTNENQVDRGSLSHIKFCQTFIAYGMPNEDSGDPLADRRRHSQTQVQLLVARVVGPEPNHVATATFAIQAALTLLMERDHLPSSGGVLTPGAAFSETNIIYQLRRRNIKFEVLKKA